MKSAQNTIGAVSVERFHDPRVSEYQQEFIGPIVEVSGPHIDILADPFAREVSLSAGSLLVSNAVKAPALEKAA